MLNPSLRRCARRVYSKGLCRRYTISTQGQGGVPQVHGKRMIDRRQVITGTAALAASLAAPRVVRAETAAEFYRGKTVRVLVGSPPGGGYDIYARLVTPALAAKLGATVLVENK